MGLAVLCSADGSDFLQLAWTDTEGRPQHAVLLLNQQELLKMPNIVCRADADTDTNPAVNSVFVLQPNTLDPSMHKLAIVLRAGHSLRTGDSAICTVGRGALLRDAGTRGVYSFPLNFGIKRSRTGHLFVHIVVCRHSQNVAAMRSCLFFQMRASSYFLQLPAGRQRVYRQRLHHVSARCSRVHSVKC